MKIYTASGPLSYRTFTFPDGQPHFELLTTPQPGESLVTIEARVKDPVELFNLNLAIHVLKSGFDCSINLDIRYLMGARMDRAISKTQPYTLGLVMSMLQHQFIKNTRVLDIHSEVARLSGYNVQNLLPFGPVKSVINYLGDVEIVIPDKGAKDRVTRLTEFYEKEPIQALKTRDMATGRLSGFELATSGDLVGKSCLIIDDICDGGGTFIGLAKVLRNAGARNVFLYVTHGVFSKPLPLEEIDHIFTTDSYHNWTLVGPEGVTCIPISMKDMV